MSGKDAASRKTPRRLWRTTLIIGGFLAAVGLAFAVRAWIGSETAQAETGILSFFGAKNESPAAKPTTPKPAANAPAAPAAPARPEVVAVVNNEQITRDELRKECLLRYGEQVLESVVNKYLILGECQRRGITITVDEVDAEVERMATRFNLPVEHWLKLLKDERGITPEQYKSDIIWPTLALRRLAGDRMAISEEEVRKLFDSRYGPAVKARMIVCKSKEKAEKVHAEAVAHPDQFGNLAKEYSDDMASASLKGLIQPIRKHIGQPEIEEAAFALKEGEISPIIPVHGEYVILKCEAHLPPMRVDYNAVHDELEEIVRDSKMEKVANEIFRELQSKAQIVNVLNDPVKRSQMPGVAAIVNGKKIMLNDLGEMCIDRHGREVLENLIGRRLIEQACRAKNITVTEADIDAEIAEMARLNLPLLPDGSPDVKRWIQMMTEQQGTTETLYRRDVVWPTVALKKLVGDTISITSDDLKKAFESNYGPRVRCRAIVLDNLRRAQTVWEKAAADPSLDNFARLAEEYSVDPANRALGGEVAPIRRYGGQPELEEEAFSLKPGELSGIVQVGPSTYVILLCLGRTEPVDVDFESVRDILYDSIRQKKLHEAMADAFAKLQQTATIDDFLNGKTQSPSLSKQQIATRPSETITR
ncbi:MAG: peptidylprolyl isomerase [Planctomycetota bacterium]|nr:MAG: peptidylprolyl isomerase [Planctomycetota bacterium]